ncbi:putative disease resistance protein RGA4 [Spatholobus suberectus]|nr:putative disease resistance protein RGA4 [Spatholobus suberectus]
MDRVKFEDACADFLLLLDNEFGTFCVSRIKQRAEELSSAVDLTIGGVLENGRVTKNQLEELKEAISKLLEVISGESHPLGGLSSFNPKKFMFRQRVRSMLNEIQARISDAAETESSVSCIQARPIGRDQDDVDRKQVYGRDADKDEIVNFLLSQARASQFPSIYPIVGPGGFGKTTLAQMVYNNREVRSHFDERIWVSVSNNFSVKKILCSIIESVAREKYSVYDLDVIERKVRDLLQFKRYLLVLDNVRTNLPLEKLKSVLSCGSKGTCILVTTRDMDVVKTMGTCLIHHLSPLSPVVNYRLFKHYAFGPGCVPPELLSMALRSAMKCMGSPLEALALGSLLRSKSEEKQWLEVLESWYWRSPDENEDYGLTTLGMIYSDLTRSSRLCFAFCAIFPPNTEIMKEDLIHLWVANGFISSGENLEVEEVGDIIWNELYEKSFFTDIKIDDYSGDISFTMLDLVHGFARSVSGQECVILDNVNMTDLSTSTLHVGFGSDLLSFNKGVLQKLEFLQTLYQFEFAFHNTISGCFPTNHSLRVLSTSYFKLSSLRNLIHLRYLELYGLEIKNLPNSIYSLQKLETLKLRSCRKLVCLPKHLTRLQNLRHLVVSECSLSSMCPNIRKLSCLRTLSLFIVSSKTGQKLEEIGGLNLGGKLRIEGLKNVTSASEAERAKLKDKEKLRELCLSWDNSGESKSNASTKAEEVLQALQPPPNLKTLRIYDYEGSRLPSWIQNLESLVALELFDCKECLQLPELGKLPSLRKLEIFSMDDVQYMDDDESDGVKVSFPSLEQLEVRGLPNLQQLLKVEREMMFPRLSNVTIDDCSKLQLPSVPSIKQLNIRGCNHELLRSISNFNGLTFLNLSGGKDLTSFPEGLMRDMTCLRVMILYDFPKLKVLPDELHLKALERLEIIRCSELESLPEQIWKGLCSLQYLEIAYCGRLRSLPKGAGEAESLEVLRIECCPELEKKYKEGTGEDWIKKAHIRKVI